MSTLTNLAAMAVAATGVFMGRQVTDAAHNWEPETREPSEPTERSQDRLLKLEDDAAKNSADAAGVHQAHEDWRREKDAMQREIAGLDAEEMSRGLTKAQERERDHHKSRLAQHLTRQPAILARGQALIARRLTAEENAEGGRKLLDRLASTGAAIEDHPAEPQKERGESWLDSATRHGREVAGKTEERHELAEASRPLDEDLADIRNLIGQWAREPELVMRQDGSGFSVEWPRQRVLAEPAGVGGIPYATDARAIACWIAPERVAESLERQIRAHHEGVTMTLTAAEKRTRLRKIDTEIESLKRLQIEALWRARDEGAEVDFPRGADPRHLLGIR
ncbi:hypothetical protein GRZ55_14140 [Chelativorans sp. ZYF759]|uniref:hypothetical protein n=1 Tax=Chelativorans sp. ZYF759 TaxID=2692213 RepID=UPI00145E494A|nr:hypothetical protein [Chelativorans sp. ZYF759]NMG40384.1 hypothetical protein [Chelativorans sp. ZYF759]